MKQLPYSRLESILDTFPKLTIAVVGDLFLDRYLELAEGVRERSLETDLEAYRPQAHEVARYCERWGMRYEEILGSDDYVRRLVDLAAAVAAAWGQPDDDFLLIPPGGEIRQEAFL